jgi:hypothetical protein
MRPASSSDFPASPEATTPSRAFTASWSTATLEMAQARIRFPANAAATMSLPSVYVFPVPGGPQRNVKSLFRHSVTAAFWLSSRFRPSTSPFHGIAVRVPFSRIRWTGKCGLSRVASKRLCSSLNSCSTRGNSRKSCIIWDANSGDSHSRMTLPSLGS